MKPAFKIIANTKGKAAADFPFRVTADGRRRMTSQLESRVMLGSVNFLKNPGGAPNCATINAIGAVGLGNFTLVTVFSTDALPPGGSDINIASIGNAVGAASLIMRFGTSRFQMAKSGVGYCSATNATNILPLTKYTIAYTRMGNAGKYYLNGIADGSCVDNFDYTANSSIAIGTFSPSGGRTYQFRFYQTALDAAAILADYNGNIGISRINADFTTAPAGAASFKESSPNRATVTMNGAASIVPLRLAA